MKLAAYVTLIAILGINTIPAASAQEGRGARFNYAPNIWKAEGSRLPKGYGDFADPQHNVRAGGVPSKNLLGLDPVMLSKPAPVPVVAATPAVPSVTSQMMVPKATPSFIPAFGKPMVAQLPAPVPQQAVALPATPAKSAAPAASAPAVRHMVRTAVGGHVMPIRPRNVQPAMGTPAVASYGNNFGYVPGTPLLTTSSSSSASGKVSGRLLTQTRHH